MHIGKLNWAILSITLILLQGLSLHANNAKVDSFILKATLIKYTNPKQSAYFAQQTIELLPVKSIDIMRSRTLLFIAR